MSIAVDFLSYKRQTNFIHATSTGSCSINSDDSTNSNISTSWSILDFKTLSHYFFPIPEKLLTESHPVMQFKAAKMQPIDDPRDVVDSCMAK